MVTQSGCVAYVMDRSTLEVTTLVLVLVFYLVLNKLRLGSRWHFCAPVYLGLKKLFWVYYFLRSLAFKNSKNGPSFTHIDTGCAWLISHYEELVVKSGPLGTSPAEVRRVEGNLSMEVDQRSDGGKQRGDLRGCRRRKYVLHHCRSHVLGDQRT